MKIAVTSQNRKTVTGHAGKCRKFWIYDVADCEVLARQMLELPMGQTFHESPGNAAHPFAGINVLITAGMGDGLHRRLKQMGIMGIATAETDPERAVRHWLDGTLKELPPGIAHDHEPRQGPCTCPYAVCPDPAGPQRFRTAHGLASRCDAR